MEKKEEERKPDRVEVVHSPFKQAESLAKRLKLFIWGDSGVGKTTLSLQFPSPVVIDLERGTDLYGEVFKFDVLKTSDADSIMQAVDWLANNQHDYTSLVIDPITMYWDALQKKWSEIFMARNKTSKGYKFEYFDIGPKEWMTIKAEWKTFLRKLIQLDMNVIVTAREKTKYRDGDYMIKDGETFDGEKGLPYAFDTVVRMTINPKGERLGLTLKDRSNKLPKEFKAEYTIFEQLFGKDKLTRKSKTIQKITAEQKSEMEKLIKEFNLTQEAIASRLQAYDADEISDLTKENANVIIEKLKAAKTNGGLKQ